MAKYFTNFSEYTENQQPSDWTKRWYTSVTFIVSLLSEAIGGKIIYEDPTTSSSYTLISWNDIDSDGGRANVEITTKVKPTGLATSRFDAYVVARGAASSGYIAGLWGKTTFKLYKNVSGTYMQIGTYDFAYASGVWYWIKLRTNGTTISAKAWADGDAEPTNWQISITDSSISAAGWAGVGGQANTISRNFDVVGIGTNGDTAPNIPKVVTDQPTDITVATATLQGNVTDTGGENPTRYFEYGPTTSYGTNINAEAGGTGIYTVGISGLTPNTTYHYRAYVVNSYGTSYGTDIIFTTEAVLKPSQMTPNNTHINPLIDNIFSWQIDASAVQTHYELQYRVVGSAEWITTGAIASILLQHEFEADTFTIDTNYEWQVKSWDSVNPTWYDWSAVTPLNTINPPVLSEISPAADSQIQLGIVNVSAKATSLYNRNCRLKLLVADNPDFTNSQTYLTAYFASGNTGTITIGLSKRGTTYIRLTAEDTEGLETVVDYSVNVIQTLYFISESQVNIQGPQATHVTVRVKDSSPVVEYTAYIAPEPTVDKRIERLVEIDTGTVVVCQSVAEQLVARWGREQKSVSGEINLTVTLDFMEKVHIIIPQASIDEEMILQQKEHQVTSMITRITLGDILLDDSELLARILDELSK